MNENIKEKFQLLAVEISNGNIKPKLYTNNTLIKIDFKDILSLYNTNDYFKAANTSLDFIYYAPFDQFAWKLLAAALEQLELYEESISANLMAVKLNFTDAEAFNNLAGVLGKINKLTEAEINFKKAISLKPNYFQAYCNLGIIQNNLGKFELAIENFDLSISINPKYADAYFNKGNSEKALYKNTSAELSFKKTIELNSNYSLAYCNLGNIYKENNDFNNALNNYRIAINLNPNFHLAFFNMANTFLQMGRYKDAEENYKTSISIDSKHAESYCNLGIVYNTLKNFDSAKDSFEKSIKLNSSSSFAFYNLGITYSNINDDTNSIINYKKSLELNPKYVEAYCNLGVILNKIKNHDEAELFLLKGLELNPLSAEISNNLGVVKKAQGYKVESLAYYKKAVHLNDKFTEAYNNLGIIYKEMGLLNFAIKNYNKALLLNNKYYEALNNLTSALIYTNFTEQLKLELQRLKSIDPDNYGLQARVNLAILFFIEDDWTLSEYYINDSINIINKNEMVYKNKRIYWKYLFDIFKFHNSRINNLVTINSEILYILGESHSFTSHNILINKNSKNYLCKALWIEGCKQWHLANSNYNEYKYFFEILIKKIPSKSTVLICIGEIDCRLEGGILSYIKKKNIKDIDQFINDQVKNYINYIHKSVINKSLHIVIQGIPCPNPNAFLSINEDTIQLVNLIKSINLYLNNQAIAIGFEFLDIHSLTNRGDGLSNKIWHLDKYHISPDGMREVWRQHDTKI